MSRVSCGQRFRESVNDHIGAKLTVVSKAFYCNQTRIAVYGPVLRVAWQGPVNDFNATAPCNTKGGGRISRASGQGLRAPWITTPY